MCVPPIRHVSALCSEMLAQVVSCRTDSDCPEEVDLCIVESTEQAMVQGEACPSSETCI